MILFAMKVKVVVAVRLQEHYRAVGRVCQGCNVAGIALQQGGVAQFQGLKLGRHQRKHIRETTC